MVLGGRREGGSGWGTCVYTCGRFMLMYGHEFEQILGDSRGQRTMA